MMIRLDSGDAKDINIAGGKGSSLAALAAKGYPVPPGFIITTAAFDDFCRNHAIPERLAQLFADAREHDDAWFQANIEDFQAEVRGLPIPQSLRELLAARFAGAAGQGLWAVRSSAVAEDLKGASFAGQYDTVLGVEGVAEITTAILHCWASFFNPNALQYKRVRNIHDNRMALVLQQLVDADSAGVCFSLNPVTGNPDQIVVNANFGLGESVVGGHVTPDTFILDKPTGQLVSQNTGSKLLKTVRVKGGSQEVETSAAERERLSLATEQLAMLSELVKQVEQTDGHAVDVEWAFSRGKLYLLQSRPVTATAMPAVQETDSPPKGWVPSNNTAIDPRFPLHTNGNISEILPGCITPLTWSRVGVTIDYAFTQQYYQLGVIDEKPDPRAKLQSLAFFYYRPYICISYFTETAKAAPGLTPDIYLEEFVGKPEKKTPPFGWGDLHPKQIFKFFRLIIGFVSNLLQNGKQVEESHAYFKAFSADLSPQRLEQLSNKELIDKVAFNETYGYMSLVHIWVSSFASAGFAVIRGLTEKWLNDKGGQLGAGLVTGIGVLPSAEPAFGLYDLARRIAESEVLGSVFAESDNQKVYAALQVNESADAAAFRTALNEFLQKHGHRGICEAELMTKCWRDEPAQAIGLIRNYLLPGVTSPTAVKERQEKARLDTTRETLGRLNPLRRAALALLLRFTKHFIHKREEVKNLITLREDRARQVFQRIASRLQNEGQLDDADDIYFLTWAEVRALIFGEIAAPEARRIINERRREYQWCQQLQMPKLIDGHAAPISLEDVDARKRLSGLGVYPGRVEGRARVIMDPRVNATIEPGEILVAPVTDAGWTPLFINAAGLVVDVGGLLSHGSVVAREYGLPAVVGAEGATRMIKTGDRIVVDGVAGTVILLDDDTVARKIGAQEPVAS
jgi:pyruvate,water dikinase